MSERKVPIYVPSKGRWESRLTSNALEELGVPYRMVIEPQEYDNYAAVIDPAKLLVLPHSDRGLHVTRNWIWEHALSEGAEWFWQIDDNIRGFYRFNYNTKIPVQRGDAHFRVVEDLCDRYENVAQGGMQYFMFVPARVRRAPLSLNCRIYSCTLNRTDLPYRYRSYYNDDTDLSLQILKGGWCTLLCNAFVANKMATMTVKGGLKELYQEGGDEGGRLKMAQSLVDLHPDVVKISWKWGRYQHEVDYSAFRNNRLILKPGITVPKGANDYGLILQQKSVTGDWNQIPTSALPTLSAGG
jgi:hypothetical protein